MRVRQDCLAQAITTQNDCNTQLAFCRTPGRPVDVVRRPYYTRRMAPRNNLDTFHNSSLSLRLDSAELRQIDRMADWSFQSRSDMIRELLRLGRLAWDRQHGVPATLEVET